MDNNFEELGENPNTEKLIISIKALQQDLKNGITRCKADTNYDEALGSIEEKYGLTKDEVKDIFRNSKLRNLKVIPVKQVRYVLVDDTEDVTSNFGTPSQAASERMHNAEAIAETVVEEGITSVDFEENTPTQEEESIFDIASAPEVNN